MLSITININDVNIDNKTSLNSSEKHQKFKKASCDKPGESTPINGYLNNDCFLCFEIGIK